MPGWVFKRKMLMVVMRNAVIFLRLFSFCVCFFNGILISRRFRFFRLWNLWHFVCLLMFQENSPCWSPRGGHCYRWRSRPSSPPIPLPLSRSETLTSFTEYDIHFVFHFASKHSPILPLMRFDFIFILSFPWIFIMMKSQCGYKRKKKTPSLWYSVMPVVGVGFRVPVRVVFLFR